MKSSRPAVVPVTPWPDTWPTIIHQVNLGGAWAPPSDQDLSIIRATTAAILQDADVHPLEAIAAHSLGAYGAEAFPPIARTWGCIVRSSADPDHQQLRTQADAAFCRAMHETLTRVSAANPRVLDVNFGMQRMSAPDLPIDRLHRLGTDRVATWLVTAVADGNDWAADVLARLGESS